MYIQQKTKDMFKNILEDLKKEYDKDDDIISPKVIRNYQPKDVTNIFCYGIDGSKKYVLRELVSAIFKFSYENKLDLQDAYNLLSVVFTYQENQIGNTSIIYWEMIRKPIEDYGNLEVVCY